MNKIGNFKWKFSFTRSMMFTPTPTRETRRCLRQFYCPTINVLLFVGWWDDNSCSSLNSMDFYRDWERICEWNTEFFLMVSISLLDSCAIRSFCIRTMDLQLVCGMGYPPLLTHGFLKSRKLVDLWCVVNNILTPKNAQNKCMHIRRGGVGHSSLSKWHHWIDRNDMYPTQALYTGCCLPSNHPPKLHSSSSMQKDPTERFHMLLIEQMDRFCTRTSFITEQSFRGLNWWSLNTLFPRVVGIHSTISDL